MADISSKNEEKGGDQGTEKPKAGWSTGKKVGLFIIVFAIIVILLVFLTMSVVITASSPGDPLPFTTTYSTSFPEGQMIQIGNIQISAISYQNSVTTDVNGNTQQLSVGQTQTIAEQHATISTLGVITILDTNFQIDLTYRGASNNRNYFDAAIHTGRQVPVWLINQILPASIDATPA